MAKHNITHGMKNSSEYVIWASMKQRCLNPKNSRYKSYGARGIYICKEWIDSFANFYKDMGPRPSPLHSIDRIDNNGPYTPANCRWATPKEQQETARRPTLIKLTIDGVTKTIKEWAIESDISANGIKYRLKQGYSNKDAVLLPRIKGSHE